MLEDTSKIDYRHLRDDTLCLLTEMQEISSLPENSGDPLASSEVEKKLADLWKCIPLRHNRPTELEVKVGSEEYPHSRHTMAYLIIYYLLENDCIDVVDKFIAEACNEEDELTGIRDTYNRFRRITKEVEEDSLELLEEFVKEDRVGGDLEAYLVCHKFLLLIYNGKYDEALRICLRDLKAFMPKYIEDVKPILKFLVNPINIQEALERNKERLMERFKADYRELNEMPNRCYLRELFETGSSAFLQLAKAGNLFFDNDDTTLPVEIKIGKGQNYHSLFVCPVLKTLCIGENGPVMLECGHVISSNAAVVLSKEGTLSSFKCPYCPEMSKYESILNLRL